MMVLLKPRAGIIDFVYQEVNKTVYRSLRGSPLIMVMIIIITMIIIIIIIFYYFHHYCYWSLL